MVPRYLKEATSTDKEAPIHGKRANKSDTERRGRVTRCLVGLPLGQGSKARFGRNASRKVLQAVVGWIKATGTVVSLSSYGIATGGTLYLLARDAVREGKPDQIGSSSRAAGVGCALLTVLPIPAPWRFFRLGYGLQVEPSNHLW